MAKKRFNTAEDLIKEMEQETDFTVSSPEDNTVNPDDFESLEDSKVNDSVHPENDDAFEESEPKEEREEPFESFEEMSQRWVDLMDFGQQLCLVPLVKKSILKDDDFKRIEAYKKSQSHLSGPELEKALRSNPDLADAMSRMDDFLHEVKNFPFSGDEKSQIVKPLSKLVEKYYVLQLSPEWSLLLSVVLVMSPRIKSLLPDLSKFFG